MEAEARGDPLRSGCAELANRDLLGAGQQLFVAKLITSRPFLPGMTGDWVERCWAEFADLRIRTLQCSARVNLANGIFTAAVRDAQRGVKADPLRESSWWLLMDAHAAIGDLASAIAVYERYRSTLDWHLGIPPSPATRQRHAALLAAAHGDHPPARAGERSTPATELEAMTRRL